MKVTLMTVCSRESFKKLPLLGVILLAIQAIQVSAANTAENEFEAIDRIQEAAELFALRNLETKNLNELSIQAAALDPRLRLKKCDAPLEAFSNSANLLNKRSTIGVRCTGETPWTLYVPITVNALSPVVYTTKPLLRGEAVSADSVEVRYQSLDRLPTNGLTDISQIIGMEVSRALPADTPLSLGILRSARLIRQGQEIIILAEGSGLSVRMTGSALKNGARGEVIPVKNASSGRVLEGRIVSESTVLVSF